jgi:predicted nucleotidyltransferase
VQEIEQRYHPQRIVLFGSYAYGAPTADSDVDLLVILDTPQRNVEQALAISRSISHPFPMDLLVLKPREVDRRLRGGDVVLREMLTKGKVLYESCR